MGKQGNHWHRFKKWGKAHAFNEDHRGGSTALCGIVSLNDKSGEELRGDDLKNKCFNCRKIAYGSRSGIISDGMPKISFEVSEDDGQTIKNIVDRARSIARRMGVTYPRQDIAMDLTATHANGNRLRLADLLAAEEMKFIREVWGIRNNLNRTTGRLSPRFFPRYLANNHF